MAAGKRTEKNRATDSDTPAARESAFTEASWRIVAACAVGLVVYLWLHVDSLRLLLSGFASR